MGLMTYGAQIAAEGHRLGARCRPPQDSANTAVRERGFGDTQRINTGKTPNHGGDLDFRACRLSVDQSERLARRTPFCAILPAVRDHRAVAAEGV